MVRVLHVLNNLGSGGAEAFVMNVYRNIDRSQVQFDFLIRSDNNGSMVDEIKSLGGKVFILPDFPKHIIQNYIELNKFLKKNAKQYKVIHVHANALIYVKPLQLAKKYGIPIRIIHSHNTNSTIPFVHQINTNRIDGWVTDRFACSNLAGKWMFSNREYKVIPNGIDLEKFVYNCKDRERIREKYNIGNKVVIGNVGRFTQQKNHPFILDVFDSYHKKNPNSVLLLVGDGENQTEIEKKVIQMGLKDDVIFSGAVFDVWSYMSSMDIFFFPSLWEGLGIVLVEAQANGLPCIISEAIPEEAILADNVYQMNLNDDKNEWVEALNRSIDKRSFEGNENVKLYDSKSVSKDLEEFYTISN